MVGAEIANIAAAESDGPEPGIVRATNSVVLRISVFFVGSIFLLATILPWNSTRLDDSPTSPPWRRWAFRRPRRS